ncbi:MAG TPA: hypothetical protein VD772_09410, partial [Anseongella sp.]|nr:hypothetical protein [Anseongella sp.]
LYDQSGNDLLWETVYYDPSDMRELYPALALVYAQLKTEGDTSFLKHLSVARVDYCVFGNSKPFRVRIVNNLNDNYDHFYIKVADASRIYGLELEHILSPNRITYFTDENTLVEEHIAGIPGDMFMRSYLDDNPFNQTRIAKEFIKFNERCFIRLLGDMRSYNYVVDITPDFEGSQFRIRAIDFDQQSYDGRLDMYRPKCFGENRDLTELGRKYLKPESVLQYQQEERALIVNRLRSSRYRLKELLEPMLNDEISPPEKVLQLGHELAAYYDNPGFSQCRSMGEIVKLHLKQTLRKILKKIHGKAGNAARPGNGTVIP